MASRPVQAGIVAIMIAVLIVLSAFIYFSYIGRFEPPFVSAVATSALVFVTVISVLTTIFLLNEQRIYRRHEIRPYIKISTSWTTDDQIAFELINIGNGPAKKISGNVKCEPDGQTNSIDITSMTSGESVSRSIQQDEDIDDLAEVDEIVFDYSCEDINDREYSMADSDSISEDSQNIPNYTRDEKYYLKQISKELSDIERELGRRR